MNQDKALLKYKQIVRSIIMPNKEFSYIERVRKLESAYMGFIESKAKQDKVVCTDLVPFWNAIKKCIELHQCGLMSDALILFYEQIFCNPKYIDTILVEPKANFYRMRKSRFGELYNRNEMFHIPFTKRQIVANERFSVTGMPSLYLSESTYICWEEMGNPDFDTCNVSLFKNGTTLSLINLTPIMETFEQKRLTQYPLAYVCALGTNYPNDPYKEEYIIPQLLMQSILLANKTSNNLRISGIRYISTKAYTERPLFPLNEKEDLKRYFNYVFPAIGPYNEEGLSRFLLNSFSWSSPETYGRYKLRTSGLQTTEPHTNETYMVSTFYQMERCCEVAWVRDNMLTYNSLDGALSF